MASPVDASRAVTVVSTAAASWPLSVPAGQTIGDLLIMIVRSGGAQTITSITNAPSPDAWNQILVDSSDATDDNTYVYWQKITSGAQATINWSGAAKGVATIYRITGAADPAVQPPQVGTRQVFTTAANAGNPPAISPAGGSKDYLFIACLALGGNTVTGATAPTGYSTGAGFANGVSTGASAATNAGLCTCTRQATTATEDVSAFTHPAANTGGTSFVIAVHPAGPTTQYGAVAGVTTFGRTVAGSKKTFGQLVRPFTFQASVAGDVVIPAQTYFGSLSLPISFDAAVNGRRKTLGQLSLPVIFGKEVQAQRKTFGQLLSPFIFGKAVAGRKTTFGQIGLPIGISIVTAGQRVGLTLYGALSLPMIFTKDVRGQRKAFGQIAMPLTFTKDVKAQRKTFGQIVFPIIFTKEAVGRKNVFGALSMQTLFGKEVAGRRRTFGQLAFPLTFAKAVAGRKQTFGKIALPINTTIVVDGFVFTGPKTYYGQISRPIIFNKQVVAQRRTFGRVISPFLFGSASQGKRRTFSKLVFPLNFQAAVKSGPVGVHGRMSFPIVVGFYTAGKIIVAGVILNEASDLYLGEQDVVAAYIGSELVWLPPRSS